LALAGLHAQFDKKRKRLFARPEMPIYEEKLISPFAVRFTQEHIRTTFRDGRSVEAAVREIHEAPGMGDYDVILKFPFPAIEIIRWHAHPREDASAPESIDTSGEVADGDHWFTLDNRRLYCLQRAAAACWPRRAAISVEILYASPGSVRRKCDTTTYGRSVTIAPSIHVLPTSRWDWRVEVQSSQQVGLGVCCAAVADVAANRAALAAILADDAKPTVDALLDLPESAGCDREHPRFSKGRPSTPSTTEPSDESDSSPKLRRSSKKGQGSRHGHQSRSQEPSEASDETDLNEHTPVTRDCSWWAIEEINQHLSMPGSNGYIWMPNWNDIYAPSLGSLRDFVESRPDQFTVVPGWGQTFRVTRAFQSSSHDHSSYSKAKGQWSGNYCEQSRVHFQC